VDLRLAILRETFSNLAALLGSLHACASELRKIYADFELHLTKQKLTTSMISEISYFNYEFSSNSDRNQFHSMCKSRISNCLDFLLSTFSGSSEDILDRSSGVDKSNFDSQEEKSSNKDKTKLYNSPRQSLSQSSHHKKGKMMSILDHYNHVKHIIAEVEVYDTTSTV
jgi:hypothetical protein